MRITTHQLAGVVAVVVAAACAEPTSAPPAQSRLVAPDRAPVFDVATAGKFGFSRGEFELTSRGGTFKVGLFTISFPANSVCDPDQSTYGAGQWDAPCVTLSSDKTIELHATVQLSAQGLAIDVQPALRFAPNAQVTIATDAFAPVIVAGESYFRQHPSALGWLAMGYSPAFGSSGVADYAGDPSIGTHVNLSTGHVWRRVKHFSGYFLAGGQPCTPSPDLPDCVYVDDGGGTIQGGQ